MKTLYPITAVLLAMLTLGACDNRLDGITPEDDATINPVFETEFEAAAAILGIYSTTQDKDAFGGTTMAMDAYWADDADFVGSFSTFQQIYNLAMSADNSSIQMVWRDLYQVIGAANGAISKIPGSPDPNFSEITKNQFTGEAKFLRALTYFNLANHFSQPFQVTGGTNDCVPLIDKPFNSTEEIALFQVPRNSLNEIHGMIAADLGDAIAFLPASADPGRASSGAATALLARLQLYREQWEEAANLANTVINASEYLLATDYNFYNKLTTEDIFTIINTTDDGQDRSIGLSEYFNPSQAGGRGDVPFSENLLGDYDQINDLRFVQLHQLGTDADGGESTFTSKFPDGTNLADNIPLIRITEMYLIRAEANLRNNSMIGNTPLNDINSLRQRADLDPLTSITLDDILEARRKELAFEGHRRMDLLRNRRALRRPGMENEAASAFGADQTILPIPQRERDQNPFLGQNPGY